MTVITKYTQHNCVVRLTVSFLPSKAKHFTYVNVRGVDGGGGGGGRQGSGRGRYTIGIKIM